jgi:hypothetical protein
MTDNEKKIDEDLQRAAEEFFAAKFLKAIRLTMRRRCFSSDFTRFARRSLKIGAKYCASSTIYADLLEAFGKLDGAGRRAIVSYLKTQTTVSQFRSRCASDGKL